jgi:hypothetical protein
MFEKWMVGNNQQQSISRNAIMCSETRGKPKSKDMAIKSSTSAVKLSFYGK